jgi:hypothetical protein
MPYCCTSPQLEFSVRNDGRPPLENDTQATISLPGGAIATEGLREIRYLLRNWYEGDTFPLTRLSSELAPLGDQWQTPAGNFTKRLSHYAYKNYAIKLPPEAVSQVGCLARNYSTEAADWTIDITRNLNLDPADFYHEDSCWWTSYSDSRCALKTNGGLALRSFSRHGRVSGRAWVMPLRQENGKLYPTFNTTSPAAFVTFNGYGSLAGYAAPRIMGYVTGWTYRKIGFECPPMCVNAGGILVAPEEITELYARKELFLASVDRHASLFQDEQAMAAEASRLVAAEAAGGK